MNKVSVVYSRFVIGKQSSILRKFIYYFFLQEFPNKCEQFSPTNAIFIFVCVECMIILRPS